MYVPVRCVKCMPESIHTVVDRKGKKVAQEKQTANRNLREKWRQIRRESEEEIAPKANSKGKTHLLLRPNGFEAVLPRVVGFSVTPPFALMRNDTNIQGQHTRIQAFRCSHGKYKHDTNIHMLETLIHAQAQPSHRIIWTLWNNTHHAGADAREAPAAPLPPAFHHSPALTSRFITLQHQ